MNNRVFTRIHVCTLFHIQLSLANKILCPRWHTTSATLSVLVGPLSQRFSPSNRTHGTRIGICLNCSLAATTFVLQAIEPTGCAAARDSKCVSIANTCRGTCLNFSLSHNTFFLRWHTTILNASLCWRTRSRNNASNPTTESTARAPARA